MTTLDLDVLVVDPHPARRGAAAAVLRGVGCRVEELAGGGEALDACRARSPAVVLADAEARVDDGLPLIDAVKRDPELFEIAVVVRARRLNVDDALGGLGRGAQGVLVDPVADAELVAAVRSAARMSVLQEELRNRAAALERLAFSDVLTGVPNRRFLERQLAALVSAARRHERPLAVACVDIDHFKAINDRFGHATGDAVLAEVAQRLSSRLRREDHLGRMGGEEFLALLPDTDAEAVAGVAEDLRAAVAGHALPGIGSERLTVSVGWAIWSQEETADDVLRRADDALYRAKSDGRNCVRGAARVSAGRGSPGADRLGWPGPR